MAHAILVRATGGPDVLRLEEREVPEPGPGQVRVRVACAGVNFIDVYHRTGLYPRELPFVPGLEGSGRVEAVGPGVTEFAPGARVAWASVPGSYAEALVAPAAALVPVPEGLADDLAAACLLQGMTAHYLVYGTRVPRLGDTALVHAAAGGTGRLLVQTLSAAGLRAIGTCSTPQKERLAQEAGCERTVRYGEADFVPAVREWTRGRGVDVVYDSVGQSTFEGSLRCLRPRGLLVLFGQSSGVVPPFDLSRLNALGSLFVTRPTLAHYTADRAELLDRASAVLRAVAAGSLRLRIDARLSLADAPRAHTLLESRATAGKLLLDLTDAPRTRSHPSGRA